MNISVAAVNPHAAQPTSIRALTKSLWHHRQLIMQMIKREVVGRYKGSAMGLAWSFFNPILMLLIYTFVFSVREFKVQVQHFCPSDLERSGRAPGETAGLFRLGAGAIGHSRPATFSLAG